MERLSFDAAVGQQVGLYGWTPRGATGLLKRPTEVRHYDAVTAIVFSGLSMASGCRADVAF